MIKIFKMKILIRKREFIKIIGYKKIERKKINTWDVKYIVDFEIIFFSQ